MVSIYFGGFSTLQKKQNEKKEPVPDASHVDYNMLSYEMRSHFLESVVLAPKIWLTAFMA